MRIVTLNVCMLYRAGALNELLEVIDKYKKDICALQEIRWPGKRMAIKKNYVILCGGHKSGKHEFGTGFYKGHLESKERFAIQRYLLIIGKKQNMQVLSHTFTYVST